MSTGDGRQIVLASYVGLVSFDCRLLLASNPPVLLWLGVMATLTAWQRKRRTDIQHKAERGKKIKIYDPIEWEWLAEVLTKSDKVTDLHVRSPLLINYRNYDGEDEEYDNGAIHFADAFVRSQTVEKLWMDRWRLHSSHAVNALETALTFSANSTRLRCLSLRHSKFLDISKLEYWTGELAKKYPLEELEINHCMLRNDHVSALVAGLKTNRTLKTIDLSDNFISDNGAFSLAGLLAKNTTLERLILYKNKINPIGAVVLVSSSKRLKILDLSYNGLDNIGGACTQIATALKGNKSLTKLELDRPRFFSDSVDDLWLEPFIEALWFNTTCTDIALTYHSRSHSNHIKLNRLMEINSIATSPEEALAKKIEEFGPAPVRTQQKRVVDEAWRSFLSGVPDVVLEEELCMRKTIDIANTPDGESISLEPDGSGLALQHQIEQAARLVEVKQESEELKIQAEEAKHENKRLRLDLEKLKECVVCQDGDKCVVLFPCSHLALCTDCESLVNQCPLCRTKIEKSCKVNIA